MASTDPTQQLLRSAELKLQELGELFSTRTLLDLGVLALSLGLAYVLVRLLRQRLRGRSAAPGGFWLGARIVDGVLWPALALAIALFAQAFLKGLWQVSTTRLAISIVLSLLVIRVSVRMLRAAFPASSTVRMMERHLSWLVWMGLVMWLTGLLPDMLDSMESVKWRLGGTPVSLRSLLEGAISAIFVLVLALWLSAAFEARLLASAGGDGNALSMRKIAANAMRAMLLTVGLLLALSAAGIPLGALGVFGGALGVGLGFGLQKLAANYVSGFVILAERSLRIGDMVRVDNFEGRVTDIHTRYTVIRALNGRESIVPNEMLITSRVENASLADKRLQLSTQVTVAYGTDIAQISVPLVAAVQAVPRVLAEPAPMVLLEGFLNDGLGLSIVFWIADPENGQGNVRSDVNLAILSVLNAAAIDIPYPQRVLRRAST